MNTPTPLSNAPLAEDDSRSLMRAGIVVLVLGLLLVGVIVVAVVFSRDREGKEATPLTVAELRADPDRYDNRSVTLHGSVDDVRQLPYLDQYAIYTFHDETGSMLALTRSGVPPEALRDDALVGAVFHSRVTLDHELKQIVEDQLGPIAGELVGLLLPGVPLNVVFLEHERYDEPSPSP